MANRTKPKEAPAPASLDAFNAAISKVLDYGPPKNVKDRRSRKNGAAR